MGLQGSGPMERQRDRLEEPQRSGRASGSQTWAGGQKEIHLHPSGLDGPEGLLQRIRFSWESGNSWERAAVETRIPPRSRPLFREEGVGVGAGAGRASGLTGDIDLDVDLRPTHVILRPAGHILSVEVTGDIGQGQPQGRRIPRFLRQGRGGNQEECQLASGRREAGGWRWCLWEPLAPDGKDGGLGEGRERVVDPVHRLSPPPRSFT